MDRDLIEDKLYQIIDQINEWEIVSTKFYSKHLNKVYPFYDGDGRMCKMLFDNDDMIWQNI